MSKLSDDAIARIEITTSATAASMQEQTEELRRVNGRLDEIAALLRPKDVDPDKPTLGDLLAHLVAQGKEQLALARQSIQLLKRVEHRLPEPAQEASDDPIVANGRPR